jgi:hypothetical protein
VELECEDCVHSDNWMVSSSVKDLSFSRIRIHTVRYSNEHNKITGRENITKYAFWLCPVGPTEKENQDVEKMLL